MISQRFSATRSAARNTGLGNVIVTNYSAKDVDKEKGLAQHEISHTV